MDSPFHNETNNRKSLPKLSWVPGSVPLSYQPSVEYKQLFEIKKQLLKQREEMKTFQKHEG